RRREGGVGDADGEVEARIQRAVRGDGGEVLAADVARADEHLRAGIGAGEGHRVAEESLGLVARSGDEAGAGRVAADDGVALAAPVPGRTNRGPGAGAGATAAHPKTPPAPPRRHTGHPTGVRPAERAGLPTAAVVSLTRDAARVPYPAAA